MEFNNEIELFFVYDENIEHFQRITDKEHLDICIKKYRDWFNSKSIYVSRAVMCFDGYLVKGQYIGKY